jgi:RNA-directed DNA polymerase
MKAVEKHIPEAWCRLYISRWLKAGIQLPGGERKERNAGTPQGGVMSP